MKILQLNITEFGCIKDRIIEPSEELNVIYGENESGKSTVLLFIKFMLYGLTRRSSANSERERSVSWSGHRAAGSMTFSNNKKRYRIERSFTENGRGGNERLSILCLDDGSTINTDKALGEFFFGVPREVFESSACVGQMRSADINGDKVASSIENMLSSADESVDTAKILKTLDGIRVGYRHKSKSGGSLYEDEQKINQLRNRIDKAKDTALSLDVWEKKLAQSRRDYEIAKREFEQKDALLGELNKVNLIKRFQKLRDMKKELFEAQSEKSDLDARLSADGFIPDRTHLAELRLSAKALAEAQNLCETKKEQKMNSNIEMPDVAAVALGEEIEGLGGKSAIIARLECLQKTVKTQNLISSFSLAAAVLLATGGVAVILLWSLFGLLGFIGLPISAFISVLCIKKKGRAKREITELLTHYDVGVQSFEERLDFCLTQLKLSREAEVKSARLDAELEQAMINLGDKQRTLEELIGRTKKGVTANIENAANEYRRLEALISEREKLVSRIDELTGRISEEDKELSHYDEDELRRSITVNIEEVTQSAIAEAERIRGFLSEKVRALSARISGLESTVIGLRATSEDPLPLSDELAELEAAHKADSEFYDALTLAMDSIEAAANAMRGSVTPLISKQASELLDKLSGGKYSLLRTTGSLGVSLDKDGYAIKSDSLSSGTRDTAYLALRLALFMRIYDGELPPLILDESLCQLDDVRAERALTLFKRLACEGVQILLFTSHSRERRILDDIGAEYNSIFL